MQRREIIKNSAFGLLGVSISGLTSNSNTIPHTKVNPTFISDLPASYPHIDPEVVNEVVGKSHSDLDRVKELVDARPELARSVWEWRYSDFESAIGAASHVGRRDIVLYLMEKGAKPTIFTFAMLGHYDVVKSMVESSPGILKTMGPHGISLMSHAYFGERMKDDMTTSEKENLAKTIEYLESLGDADGEDYLEISPEEQQKYLGDYKYGEGADQGFTIKLNMRKMIALGPIGEFGGGLFRTAENEFIYNGAPSVKVSFEMDSEVVKSLTITEPGITLTAKKVS